MSVEPTLHEIHVFQTTGKMPESLKKRRREAEQKSAAEASKSDEAVQAQAPAPQGSSGQDAEPDSPVTDFGEETITPKPTADNKKSEIVAYLKAEGIDHDAREKKEDLLSLIQ